MTFKYPGKDTFIYYLLEFIKESDIYSGTWERLLRGKGRTFKEVDTLIKEKIMNPKTVHRKKGVSKLISCF